jgi:hypothetical protein
VLEQTRLNAGQFVWDAIPSVEDLGRVRMAAMRGFLEDYEQGKSEGRYVDAELPALPFPDASFDLALCSHLLFLYGVSHLYLGNCPRVPLSGLQGQVPSPSLARASARRSP